MYMKSLILNIPGITTLSKNQQKEIKGGGGGSIDLSLCGCSCSGAVTGPKYCEQFISCPQVHTC